MDAELLWRPATSQIVWLSGAQLEAYDVAAKRQITIYQGIPPARGTSQDIGLFRYDGSAVLIGPTSNSIFGTPVPQLLLLSSNTAVPFDPGTALGFSTSVRLR